MRTVSIITTVLGAAVGGYGFYVSNFKYDFSKSINIAGMTPMDQSTAAYQAQQEVDEVKRAVKIGFAGGAVMLIGIAGIILTRNK